jgi:hypothetical protein
MTGLEVGLIEVGGYSSQFATLDRVLFISHSLPHHTQAPLRLFYTSYVQATDGAMREEYQL